MFWNISRHHTKLFGFVGKFVIKIQISDFSKEFTWDHFEIFLTNINFRNIYFSLKPSFLRLTFKIPCCWPSIFDNKVGVQNKTSASVPHNKENLFINVFMLINRLFVVHNSYTKAIRLSTIFLLSSCSQLMFLSCLANENKFKH